MQHLNSSTLITLSSSTMTYAHLVLRGRPQLGYIDVQLVASPSGAPLDLTEEQ